VLAFSSLKVSTSESASLGLLESGYLLN